VESGFFLAGAAVGSNGSAAWMPSEHGGLTVARMPANLKICFAVFGLDVLHFALATFVTLVAAWILYEILCLVLMTNRYSAELWREEIEQTLAADERLANVSRNVAKDLRAEGNQGGQPSP